MSFPSNDAFWADVATFLDTHITDEDDILAPPPFEYRLVHFFPYRLSATVPAQAFQWVVVHKGMMDQINLDFMLDAVKHLQPVYANPVFVVLSSNRQLPALQSSNNNDLLDFGNRLRDLAQAQMSPAASAASAADVPDPSATATARYPTPPNTDLKLSIITVCRNAADTIATTIEAIAQQTYPTIEYIVVDGASDDGTLDLCQAHSDTITTLVSEPDDGIYQAMNKGIGLSTGDWLYFANADDYLVDAYVVQDLITHIHQNPDSDVVYGDHEARFPNGNTSIYASIEPEAMLDAIICFKAGCLLQPACFFKASVFDTVGGFREDYAIASDYQWFLDALQVESLRFSHMPRTVVSYAHGGRSGNIRALFDEIFDIQNNSPICQTPEWQLKRTQALQQDFINKYERMEEFNRQLNATGGLPEIRDRHLTALKQRLSRSLG